MVWHGGVPLIRDCSIAMMTFSFFLDENTAPVSRADKNVVSAARKVANALTQAVTSSCLPYSDR
jgi:hypothetical protein